MSTIVTVSREIAGRKMTLESGRLANQANGAVTVQYGETLVFAAVTMASNTRDGLDFFPLTVDYRENRFAAGKLPGGFFKREGRPSEKETLTSRCIDRPIRPLFPDGFNNEVQCLVNVLSYDQVNDPDICGMIAVFAALEISDIPFRGGIGAVRIGREDGRCVVNPMVSQAETGTVNLTIAGSRNAIMMVEGGAREESEEVILEALDLAQEVLREVIDCIDEFRGKCGKPKEEVSPIEKNVALQARVRELALDPLKEANLIPEKQQRQESIDQVVETVKTRIIEEIKAERQGALDRGEISAGDVGSYLAFNAKLAAAEKEIKEACHDLEKEIVRKRIVNEGLRSDNRRLDEIRPISCEVGLIPRTHGSAIFTRGQTQALVTTTLGTVSDEQKVDGLTEEFYKKFMLHYNFPPYSVGEVRPIRGPGRREIGHGALAERSLQPLMPDHDQFPYTIRVVSDIMESNGSSSMASVCGGSLSLMDTGVPMRAAVAGIAMGLIAEDDKIAVLSDILGLEDHLGDMDFKVAGTRNGITAFQMDLKIEGITREIMAQALEQARRGRLHILDIMDRVIDKPREQMSPYAPRIEMKMIPIDKIRDVIGPGGKMIRKIISETGAKIDIDDDGRVVIASSDEEACRKACEWIDYLTEEVEVGKIYKGKVTRLVNFGAFVEVLPGQEGLVHISELDEKRVEFVNDVVNEGEEIDVKVMEIDDFGRINLSKRQADRDLGKTAPGDYRSDRDRGGGGGSSNRGNRGGRSSQQRDPQQRDRGDRGGRDSNRGGGGRH
ncbi:MAG: polyribonucleotide nucleotidyltransferase [Candidatus Omnitrophota bacterium]|jgi:polyribonucleotide nucleotidyltransferase|nr:MAG: polyribonucleotide nucleotidyltransferase [Candidatus Omnitrophota bacterium]